MNKRMPQGFLGRVLVGTFLPIWAVMFFGMGVFGMIDSKGNDSEILGGLLFGMFAIFFAVILIKQWVPTKSKEQEKISPFTKMFQTIFFFIWCGGVVTMVIPNTLGRYSWKEILNSRGIKIFAGALLIGLVYAMIMEKISPTRKKTESPEENQQDEIERNHSYNEEKQRKGFFGSFFGNDKNNRFRR